jgi:NADH-quinone oxidoreductase subunit L
MLTAFYMTRMMVMTFHGTNRTGAEEERHLHEAPAVMWIPLAILALLSVFGGWVSVPAALREVPLLGLAPISGEWLHHWLEPVMARAHEVQLAHLGEVGQSAPIGGGEVAWAIVSTLAALAVVVAAFLVVGRQDVRPVVESSEPVGFARVLYNKYYVDELYDRVIVQPIVRASKFSWRVIDATIIDGTVNAVGWVAKGVGALVSMFQTGTVNTYAFVLTLGVLVILGVTVF